MNLSAILWRAKKIARFFGRFFLATWQTANSALFAGQSPPNSDYYNF